MQPTYQDPIMSETERQKESEEENWQTPISCKEQTLQCLGSQCSGLEARVQGVIDRRNRLSVAKEYKCHKHLKQRQSENSCFWVKSPYKRKVLVRNSLANFLSEINRPCVTGAVLQTVLLLWINQLTDNISPGSLQHSNA